MELASRNLRIDNRPLYAKAVEVLTDLIADETFAQGQLLPSEGELAKQLGVSRSTIREAISHLEKDRLITRRQGVGTFVTERSQERLTGGLERLQSFRTLAGMAKESAEMVERSVELIAAEPVAVAVLRVPEGSPLVRLDAIEAVRGCRIAFLRGLISADFVEAGNGSLLEYIIESTNYEPTHTRSEVYAIDADADLSRRLEVEEGRSVLYLAETLYTGDDKPLALLHNYFLTERFNFTIFRRVVVSKKRG